jgi:uncharacterized protein YndB with AHSA1/START domain
MMGLWLMEVEGFELRVGCRFLFRTAPAPGFDGLIHCELLSFDPPRELSYTWASGAQRSSPTIVTWRLVPEGANTTRLVLEHTGFRGVRGLLLRTMLGRGWGRKMSRYMPLLLNRASMVGDDPTMIDRAGLLACPALPPSGEGTSLPSRSSISH